jgi:deoxyadenosine/deoxycytidine kinase
MSEHVVVVGNIGAGKTTAVRALGAALGAAVYDERFEGNPYLEGAFADSLRWAGLSQLWFLGEVAAQHHAIAAADALAVQEQSVYSVFEVMTGHLLDAGLISGEDYALSSRHYDVLAARLPAPACVVCLQAPVDVLLGRIQSRGRAFERSIDEAFLLGIERRLDEFVSRWERSPLIDVDAVEVDLRDVSHAERLAHTVRATLDAGG